MPRATGHDIHVDQHLTNVAINYRPEGMIADQIAPIVSVAKQSDFYPIWDQGDILRVETATRGPGEEAKKITRSVSSGAYYAENYALKTPLTVEDRENMDPAFYKLRSEGKAEWLVDKMGLVWEYRVAQQCTSGSNVYSYSACASAWTDYTNSDPLSDLWTAIDVIQDATGYKPNSLLMGGQAWRNFRRNETVKNELYGSAGSAGGNRMVSRENAKTLFEVERFLVGEAYYDTAAEGQTMSISPLWADHVLLYYAPMAASTEKPSFMYSFRWKRPGLANLSIERHPFDAKTKSEEIELGVYQDEVITASTLAYLFTNVTSST